MLEELAEVAKEGMKNLKETSFKEINQKISPSELLNKLDDYSISGDSDEKYQIMKEVDVKNNEIDTLKEKISQTHPYFNEQNINKMKGNISENLMNEYFKRSGWSIKEGEVGANGIDGLYIKRDSEGKINKVLFVESKYNTSKLSLTNNGMQMSQDWIQAKVDNLIKAYPKDQDYKNINELLSEGKYRTRLWNMNEVDNKLSINLKNIDSKQRDVSITKLNANESYKINSYNIINLKSPNTIYETKIVDNYNYIIKNNLTKGL